MTDPQEIVIEVPKPWTLELLKTAIEDKLRKISTDLRKRGDEVVVTIRANHIDEPKSS